MAATADSSLKFPWSQYNLLAECIEQQYTFLVLLHVLVYKLYIYTSRFLQLAMYTAKLLFHQSPTRHSDYTVTTTVTM